MRQNRKAASRAACLLAVMLIAVIVCAGCDVDPDKAERAASGNCTVASASDLHGEPAQTTTAVRYTEPLTTYVKYDTQFYRYEKEYERLLKLSELSNADRNGAVHNLGDRMKELAEEYYQKLMDYEDDPVQVARNEKFGLDKEAVTEYWEALQALTEQHFRVTDHLTAVRFTTGSAGASGWAHWHYQIYRQMAIDLMDMYDYIS